jgi:hypothetical protein
MKFFSWRSPGLVALILLATAALEAQLHPVSIRGLVVFVLLVTAALTLNLIGCTQSEPDEAAPQVSEEEESGTDTG